MKSIASRVPVILTGVVLLSAVVLLTTSRLEYCGQPEALQPRVRSGGRVEDTVAHTCASPENGFHSGRGRQAGLGSRLGKELAARRSLAHLGEPSQHICGQCLQSR